MNYLYALCDPRKAGCWRYGGYLFDYQPFYIGKTNRVASRIKSHLHYLYNAHKPVLWKSEEIFISSGLLVHTEVLDTFLTSDEAFREEQELIGSIGRKDKNKGPLLNLTDGGEGARNYVPTAESIERVKQSKAMRTPEQKKKHYEATTGKLLAYVASLTPNERSELAKRGVRTLQDQGRYEIKCQRQRRTLLNKSHEAMLLLLPKSKTPVRYLSDDIQEKHKATYECLEHGKIRVAAGEVKRWIAKDLSACPLCNHESLGCRYTKTYKTVLEESVWIN